MKRIAASFVGDLAILVSTPTTNGMPPDRHADEKFFDVGA
jgi:hypothetical protein